MALTHVKTTIPDVLKNVCINGDTLAALQICENELGNMKKMVQVAGQKNGTIFLRVQNPVYMQEIRIRRKELIKKINGNFGADVIREIKFI